MAKKAWAKQDWKKSGVRKSGGKITGTVIVNTQTGEEKTLLNPHGKYKKYSLELDKGKLFTNTGKEKLGENGKVQELTVGQKAYRAGYKSAIVDQTKAYKSGGKHE